MHVVALDIETLTPEPDPPPAEGEKAPFPQLPYHRPCCIVWFQGYRTDKVPFRCKWSGGIVKDEAEETATIRALMNDLAKPNCMLVTYNGQGFDLPLVRLRALALGIGRMQRIHRFFLRFPPRNQDLPHHLDVMEFLSNYGSVRPRWGLSATSQLFGIEDPKIGSDGSCINKLWNSGKFQEIHDYCRGDVWATWLAGLRILRAYGMCQEPEWEDRKLAQREGGGE